jgi:hypothetical protein
MNYIFDSSTLIKVFNHYYREQFPSFWQKFDEAILNGKIISVRAVKNELKDKENGLSAFVERNDIFYNPTDEETIFIATIFQNRHFQSLISKKARLLGREVADPYLIAKAKISNSCVVTEEKLKANAAKIPNVCQNFKVSCVNFEGFMKKEGWSF